MLLSTYEAVFLVLCFWYQCRNKLGYFSLSSVCGFAFTDLPLLIFKYFDYVYGIFGKYLQGSILYYVVAEYNKVTIWVFFYHNNIIIFVGQKIRILNNHWIGEWKESWKCNFGKTIIN